MLDLRRQRQRNRALSPLEAICVPAVRNHDVRQKCAAKATSATVCPTGKSSSPNSRTPTASPRLVTGANKRAPPASPTTSTAWAANARPCGVPTNGTRSAVSFPCVRNFPFPPEWPSRISDRPLKSAIKKLTSRAPIASASALASASTAATGGAASTAASNEFKFNGKCRFSPISPNLTGLRSAYVVRDTGTCLLNALAARRCGDGRPAYNQDTPLIVV